jgi:hypothetical protein
MLQELPSNASPNIDNELPILPSVRHDNDEPKVKKSSTEIDDPILIAPYKLKHVDDFLPGLLPSWSSYVKPSLENPRRDIALPTEQKSKTDAAIPIRDPP